MQYVHLLYYSIFTIDIFVIVYDFYNILFFCKIVLICSDMLKTTFHTSKSIRIDLAIEQNSRISCDHAGFLQYPIAFKQFSLSFIYRIRYLDYLILRFSLSSLLSYSITTCENGEELLCLLTEVSIGHRFDQVAQKRIIKLLALLRTDAVTTNKGKSVVLREINCSLVRLNGDLLYVSQSWHVAYYARIKSRQLLSHRVSVTGTFLHALSVFQTAVFQRNEIRLCKTWCRQRPLINISCPVTKIADILTISNCIPSFHFPPDPFALASSCTCSTHKNPRRYV